LINQEVIKALEIKTINIPAEDNEHFIDSKYQKTKKNTFLPKNIKKKISETAGLENNLIIGINSRVMLRRNIDVNKGLCNGALGNVTKIDLNAYENRVQTISVMFDCHKNLDSKETVIERINSDFEIRKNIYANRSQFPLTLAWAITIHKCQGITLDHVLIDLGQDIFEDGQAYVALSRGKELKNIHLIDFD
jgi:ATP-dependent DNA helicase PIF1